MGLNIVLYSSKPQEEYSLDWFDDSRHTWDREFSTQDFFEIECIDFYEGDNKYRIKDLDKALKWISTIDPEGNRERLTKLVTEVHNNDFLWIEFSY